RRVQRLPKAMRTLLFVYLSNIGVLYLLIRLPGQGLAFYRFLIRVVIGETGNFLFCWIWPRLDEDASRVEYLKNSKGMRYRLSHWLKIGFFPLVLCLIMPLRQND